MPARFASLYPAARIILVIAFALLSRLAAARAPDDDGTPRIMQGPMVGAVTRTDARIWVRGSGVFSYAVEYATSRDFTNAARSEPQTADKGHDYTMVFVIRDLVPDTRYFFRVLPEGKPDKYIGDKAPGSFQTAPEGAAAFRLAFGSCARFQASQSQPIWGAVERMRPDLFFWVGDNIYGDALDPDILAEEYRRQRDIPGIHPVLQHVPQLATWDDHDSALNDHNTTNPVKHLALEVFKRYWANPSFGEDSNPGVYFQYRYGDVEFYFLDVRYHRTPNAAPDGPEKTILGPRQYDWLVRGLESSDAVFKVLVSGSGFTAGKGPTGDAWSAFLTERDRLFRTIAERGIHGVVLLSGDTHCAELNRIGSPYPGGYDLIEVVSSPLAQEPSAASRPILVDPEERIKPVYNMAPNAGILDFDTTLPDPTITVRLVNGYGNEVWTPFVIRASELRPSNP